jgi:hypothetical protein
MLGQVMDVIDAPRRGMFELLGSQDGSGAGLLAALLGVDPNSSVGRYGGMATEMALDPLNLFLGGLAGGGSRLARAMMMADRAEEAAGLGRQIGALEDVIGAPRLADETVSMRAGPGGLPLGSSAELLPEAVQTVGRKSAGAAGPVMGAELTPTTLTGRPAATWMDQSRRQLSSGLGDLYSADLLPDLREGMLRSNAVANRGIRQSAWDASGTVPVTPWEALGPSAGGIVNDAAAAGLTNVDEAKSLLAALLQRQAALGGPLDSIIPDLFTAGAGGALGGRVGTQAMGY